MAWREHVRGPARVVAWATVGVLAINLSAMIPLFFHYCWFLTIAILGGGSGFLAVAPLLAVGIPTTALWAALPEDGRRDLLWIGLVGGFAVLWAIVSIVLFSTVGFWECENLDASP